MLARREHVLMRLQRVQQAHDELAHRDILSFSLYKRLKHMVLHFYKYAGNLERAKASGDQAVLSRILIDTLIICLASANALNISLGEKVGADSDSVEELVRGLSTDLEGADLFAHAVTQLLLIGGQMAKTMESSDHMEQGNARAEMEKLVPELTVKVLAILGSMRVDIDVVVRERLTAVERKSVFRNF